MTRNQQCSKYVGVYESRFQQLTLNPPDLHQLLARIRDSFTNVAWIRIDSRREQNICLAKAVIRDAKHSDMGLGTNARAYFSDRGDVLLKFRPSGPFLSTDFVKSNAITSSVGCCPRTPNGAIASRSNTGSTIRVAAFLSIRFSSTSRRPARRSPQERTRRLSHTTQMVCDQTRRSCKPKS
jgi:hypothetical protein